MAEFTEEQVKDIMEVVELHRLHFDRSFRADDSLDMDADDGTNDLVFETVKYNRVLVLEHLSGFNNISACTRIRVGYYNGHRLNWLVTQPAPLVTETVAFDGLVYLRAQMYAIVRFEGCTEHDDIFASLNGYWIPAVFQPRHLRSKG